MDFSPPEFRRPLQQLPVVAKPVALGRGVSWLGAEALQHFQPYVPAQRQSNAGNQTLPPKKHSHRPQPGPSRGRHGPRVPAARPAPPRACLLASLGSSTAIQLPPTRHFSILHCFLNHLLLKSIILQPWCCTYFSIKMIKHCLLLSVIPVQ